MSAPVQAEHQLEQIRAYYGRVLTSSEDLKTGACCAPAQGSGHLGDLIRDVHPEVRDRFYGCGVPLPPSLEGATVLDLGCGTGRDVFVLSRLVGEAGRVIGVDMTPEQLDIASRHRTWHAERFGYAESNVELHEGLMEDLRSVGIEDESIDVVVSNCVFNLSPNKPRLFREVFRVLKPGGELYFSDVFADRRVPARLRTDPVLLGECLAGSMYVEDFRRTSAQNGCTDPRQCAVSSVPLLDPEIERKIGMIEFTSRTFRAFKLDLEDRCEDYGQVATYQGTIEGHPHVFELDDHHRLETGRPLLVCGNTADMLSKTRLAPHFRVEGDRSSHFGLFDCGPGAPDPATTNPGDMAAPAACC